MQYEGKQLRHELKYYINYDTYHVLRERLRKVIRQDPNMTNDNGYLISSIYLDDMYHSAVEEKTAGTRFRKKFRIRSYDRDNRLIRLECKSKYQEYIAKTSAMLSQDEYDQILKGSYDFLIRRPDEVSRELFCYNRTKRMRPVVVVEYLREAYISEMGNVRITFDKEISSSVGTLDLFAPEYKTKKVLQKDLMVLEVKYDDYLPSSIKSVLQTTSADKCAISKYVMCREERRRMEYI